MEIKQLSSDVVDKIAAGEVVERPAHLLKELLENSVDAGATHIEIEVDHGGRSIKVTDDGKGVIPSEIPLVFARHATSKIEQSDDLWQLSTFGFRGEAIASISSVSRLDFISRRRGEKKAYRIRSEFGVLSEVTETSAGEGTQVVVESLFENIPARLKFLKSDSAEISQIKNVVKAMALQYPALQWKLNVKNQLVYFWPASSTLERCEKVLESKKLFETQSNYQDFKVHAVFSDPSTVVKVSRQIWIFVQNRWVQDKGLQAAVMEAYRSLLMHGQYPICYISLSAPPDQVDVNIHPTKSQVKFVDSSKAFRSVYYCIREALEKAPWISDDSSKVKKSQQKNQFSENQNSELNFASQVNFQSPTAFKTNDLTFSDQELTRAQFKQKQNHLNSYKEEPVGPKVAFSDFKNAGERDFSALTLSAKDLSVLSDDKDYGHSLNEPIEKNFESLDADQSEETFAPRSFWSSLQVIGQVDLTYIVAQASDKMILVDQHAAHERVAFERLMNAWKNNQFEVQSMLFPLTIDLEEPEIEILLTLSSDLKKMGVEIEQAGPSSLAINTLPAFVSETGLIEALKKLATESLEQGSSFALEKTITDIFATMACHSVVRAGQAMSLDEMKQLLNDMDEFPLSGFCPHGRSVSLEFPFLKLEKDFGRRG